jgi:hypothetical protein
MLWALTATTTEYHDSANFYRMLRFLKKFAWAGFIMAMLQGASAFTLVGPFDDWQTTTLSYRLPGDLGGPQNLGEEYRWNIPVLFYAADQSFLDYFGSNGIVAIDKAMGILNSLSNASSYSSNLAEVPMQTTRLNFRAQALGLIDLSSTTLGIMMEGMGLEDPVRYTWSLRSRVGSCPGFEYFVIQRNFDPANWEPTPYVNGTLYTYRIIDFCPLVDQADAFERRVDPLQPFTTAVAGFGFFDSGTFYTGLTRDDVGGLRYIYHTNNVNLEESGPGTQTFVTNTTATLITTSNLNFFAATALTNDAATLAGLFPGLQITSVSNTFTYVPITNIIATFTNSPWAPAGSFAQLVFATNVTFTFQQLFTYTFANIFSVQSTTNGFTLVPITTLTTSSNRAFNSIQTVSATISPFAPPGTNTVATTNISTRSFITNQMGGEFIILPPGVCDIAVLATLATNVVITTNQLVVSTNTFGATNVNGQFFSQSLLQYSTNHTFLYFPVICDTTNVSFKQGIEKITFIRRDFDSLLGRFFYPITNEYVLNSITNSRIIPERVRRVVTAPDIVFSADDITPFAYLRSVSFVSNGIVSGNNGPGLIEPQKSVTFNKVGPVVVNEGPLFLDEQSNFRGFFQWGFYEGTTNAPIVFPSGTSIMDFENEILTHVTTTTLPGGTNGLFYTAQLQGTGGQSPFTWSLAPGSASLPPGLGEFSAACDCWVIPPSGLISGTPTTPGTYTFTVVMTDAANQSVTRDLTIIISP